ncbi:ADPribosylation factor subfamily protein [Pelomyxa schiedti]|nr:ADPribosylation factor subfamily protein [Pelomyxa schiedti]
MTSRWFVVTWGDASYGQLGHSWSPTGGPQPQHIPSPVFLPSSGISSAPTSRATAAPAAHGSCSGDGGCATLETTSPEATAPKVAVACGGSCTCVVDDVGSVYEWGADKAVAAAVTVSEMTGRKYSGPQCKAPAVVKGMKSCRIKRISCGGMHSMAIEDMTNCVWLWGEVEGKSKAPAIIAELKPVLVTHVSAGDGFSVVCCKDGTVFSWGTNSHGQLGLGDCKDRKKPEKIDLRVRITKSACGGQHTLFLTDLGTVFSCGANRYGQLGVGDTAERYCPHPVNFQPSEIFTEVIDNIACGDCHSLATTQANHPNFRTNIFSWGRHGNCGFASASDTVIPQPLSDFNMELFNRKERVIEISANGSSGESHSGIVSSSGKLYMFGSNRHGQCGQPCSDYVLIPTQILSVSAPILSVSCGWLHTAAVCGALPTSHTPSTPLGAFSVLPTPLLWHLLSFIKDPQSLLALGRTSKALRIISSSDSLWKPIFSQTELKWTRQGWLEAELASPNRAIYKLAASMLPVERIDILHSTTSLEDSLWKLKFLMRVPEYSKFLQRLAQLDDSRKHGLISKLSGLLSLEKRRNFRVLMIGLDAAGSLTTLYMWKLGEVVSAGPNIGFCVETIPLKGADLTVWAVGGIDKIRPLWRHYYDNTQCIIYIVDSNDRRRFEESRQALWTEVLSSRELVKVPLCVLANKQDLPSAVGPDEIIQALGLRDIPTGSRDWHVQPTTAITHEGIWEALEWVVQAILRNAGA